MVVYVVVTSFFFRNVAFLIYALFGEISILEIPVVGNFSLFAGLGLASRAAPLSWIESLGSSNRYIYWA